MELSSFDFELPPELIARHPTEVRDASRLMHLKLPVDAASKEEIHDRKFADLRQLLRDGDLLVMNNSHVFAARLEARKSTGGRVEILLVEPSSEYVGAWKVMLGASKKVQSGQILFFEGGETASVEQNLGEGFHIVRFSIEVSHLVSNYGCIPLPPYLKRQAQDSDVDRYQTVYSQKDKWGSVAAPTAGLHFTESLLSELRSTGVEIEMVTLHVGPGTFMTPRQDKLDEIKMHSERFEISQQTADAINRAQAENRRVIAVGTTTTRVLESFRFDITPGLGRTELFIRPGHVFKHVSALITNFHLPKSTLIVLVSAFAGKQCILSAYQQAIAKSYRFFSYGDAMFIERG